MVLGCPQTRFPSDETKESAACGCVPELVIEGKTGFAHRAGDADDLAEKMLLAPEHFADIGATAGDCIGLIADYSPKHAARQILAGIRSILMVTPAMATEATHAG